MKTTIIIIQLLISSLLVAQTQIGADIDGTATGNLFGTSTAISADGNTIAAGSILNSNANGQSGHVRVFMRIGNTWTIKGSPIIGSFSGDQSGYSIALSNNGNIIAIGSRYNGSQGPSSGQIRVFKWNGSSWAQLGQDINGKSVYSDFGSSVSMNASGTRIVGGGPTYGFSQPNIGYASVFEWNGSSWIKMGADILGDGASDQFGKSVSMSDDGNRMVIGGPTNDSIGRNGGHARIYEWNGTVWNQLGGDLLGNFMNDRFGESCSISGNGQVVAVGAYRDSINQFKGYVHAYIFNGSNWILKGQAMSGLISYGSFGKSISLNFDGSRLIIGNPEGSASGLGRFFYFLNGSWVQIGQDIVGEAANDESGYSIAIDSIGNTTIIGAIQNAGNGTNSGHVRVFDLNNLVGFSNQIATMKSLEVYPNPFRDVLNVKNEEGLLGTLTIRNSLGQKVKEVIVLNETQLSLNLNNEESGIYFVEFNSNDGESFVQKLVKY